MNLDGEAAHQALKIRHVVEGALAGANNHQASVHLFAQCLGNFLNVEGGLRVLADELLNFVEHQKGAGHFAIG